MSNYLLKISLIVLILCVASCKQRKNYLKCGQQLFVNQYLQSNNGYYAVVQPDCNFVIYASHHFVGRNSIWSTKTSRTDCKNPILSNQKDGNVVLYSNNKSIWSTMTNKSENRCYQLVMQDDGNLVLYDQNNKAVWNSKTSA